MKVNHQRIYSSPFGKLWNASIPTLLWNAVSWWCKDRFPTTGERRGQAGGRKHLTTETVLFSPFGEDYYVSILYRYYAFSDIFVLCSHELGQRSSRNERSQTIWKAILAQQRSWYEFFMDALWWLAVWWKRLDLLLTIRQGFLNIPVLTERQQGRRKYLRLPQF